MGHSRRTHTHGVHIGVKTDDLKALVAQRGTNHIGFHVSLLWIIVKIWIQDSGFETPK